MKMAHPLTDEICDQITDELSVFSIEDCMRDAADWQLEQVIEFIKKEDTVYAEYIYEAMRPTQLDTSPKKFVS